MPPARFLPVAGFVAGRRHLASIASIALLTAVAASVASPAGGAEAERGRLRVAHPEAMRALFEGLAPAFERATGIAVEGKTIRAFEDVAPSPSGAPAADVVLTSDPETLLHQASAERVPRYLVFASDAMVVAYARRGAFAKELEAGKPWFESLHADGVLFGRTDPEESRLGLRSILVLQLASEYYDAKHLVSQVLLPTQVMPEDVILERLAAETLDVAILYRSLAVERKIALAELPIEINLADPGRAGVYAEAKVDIGGQLHPGSPILLAAAPIPDAENAAAASRFVDFLGTAPAHAAIEASGFVVPPGVPAWRARGALHARPRAGSPPSPSSPASSISSEPVGGPGGAFGAAPPRS